MITTIAPTIVASCCKLSAHLLQRRIVSWKQCFIFAFILVALSIPVNGGMLALMGILVNIVGIVLPAVVGMMLAVTIFIGFGSWFFSCRATYANGQPLGWRGGAELTALSGVCSATIGWLLMTAATYFRTL